MEDHLRHLDTALSLLDNLGVMLSLGKCHFTYPSLHALGHKVSSLGLSTADDKVNAIRKMDFPKILQDLEKNIAFFNYYHRFVEQYVGIVRPLQ